MTVHRTTTTPEPQALACAKRSERGFCNIANASKNLPRSHRDSSGSSHGHRKHRGPRRFVHAGARAFSLLELMIAIIILGVGLIMVATMFPVAWNRARELSEFTSEVSITEAADATVKLLMRVNRGDPYVKDHPRTPLVGSFAGDLVFDPDFRGLGNPRIIAVSDTRVHQLYLENMTVARKTKKRAFLPQRDQPWSDYKRAPWSQERTDVRLTILDDCADEDAIPSYCDGMFLSPQVRLESRLYPAMEPRPGVDADGTLSGTGPEAQMWDEAFDVTRFAWAVFHKLDEPLEGLSPGVVPTPEQAEAAVHEGRTFRMYYVALRRPQPTLRYARQDTAIEFLPDPTPSGRGTVVVPGALPPTDDVLLPVPWRVQVYFPGDEADPDVIPPQTARTGIPTVVQVNTDKAPTAGFVVDMFPRGAFFIDEVNGQVFKVVKRRLAGEDLDEAFLTLDREVVVEDIDDGPAPLGGSHTLEPEELVRTVWVFPPPVDSLRGSDDEPIFAGKQPVIGIETKILKFPPE